MNWYYSIACICTKTHWWRALRLERQTRNSEASQQHGFDIRRQCTVNSCSFFHSLADAVASFVKALHNFFGEYCFSPHWFVHFVGFYQKECGVCHLLGRSTLWMGANMKQNPWMCAVRALWICMHALMTNTHKNPNHPFLRLDHFWFMYVCLRRIRWQATVRYVEYITLLDSFWRYRTLNLAVWYLFFLRPCVLCCLHLFSVALIIYSKGVMCTFPHKQCNENERGEKRPYKHTKQIIY